MSGVETHMRFVSRLFVAALAGAVIAWVVTAVSMYALFAAGGYATEAVVELPPGYFAMIGGGGALVGFTAALLVGRFVLPEWVKSALLGSLTGVAVVVGVTFVVASIRSGPFPNKANAPYLEAGLVYGVPIGLIAGAVRGLMKNRVRKAT